MRVRDHQTIILHSFVNRAPIFAGSFLTMGNLSNAPAPVHPYYPLGIEVVGYLANEYSVPLLLGLFAGGCAAVFGLTWVIVERIHPNLRSSEKATILWFILCASL